MPETLGQKLTPWLGKTLLTYVYDYCVMQSGRKLLAISELFPFVLFLEMRMKRFSTLAGNLMNVITGILLSLFLMITTEQNKRSQARH